MVLFWVSDAVWQTTQKLRLNNFYYYPWQCCGLMVLRWVILAQDVSYEYRWGWSHLKTHQERLSKMVPVILLDAYVSSVGFCLWQRRLGLLHGGSGLWEENGGIFPGLAQYHSYHHSLMQAGGHIDAISWQGACQGPSQRNLWDKG